MMLCDFILKFIEIREAYLFDDAWCNHVGRSQWAVHVTYCFSGMGLDHTPATNAQSIRNTTAFSNFKQNLHKHNRFTIGHAGSNPNDGQLKAERTIIL